MLVVAVIALGISGVLCFGEKCENSVTLTPSPEAIVGEGETLYLQCDYTGLCKPDFINWYLNKDTFGLVIDARHNHIQAQANGYETERYTTSCNATSFTLSIANISQAKDGGDKWECDVTIIGEKPTSKASTVVKIKTADEYDDKSGSKSETNHLFKVIFGILGGLMIVTIALGYVIYRINKKDVINGYVMNYWAINRNSRQSCKHNDKDGDDF